MLETRRRPTKKGKTSTHYNHPVHPAASLSNQVPRPADDSEHHLRGVLLFATAWRVHRNHSGRPTVPHGRCVTMFTRQIPKHDDSAHSTNRSRHISRVRLHHSEERHQRRKDFARTIWTSIVLPRTRYNSPNRVSQTTPSAPQCTGGVVLPPENQSQSYNQTKGCYSNPTIYGGPHEIRNRHRA